MKSCYVLLFLVGLQLCHLHMHGEEETDVNLSDVEYCCDSSSLHLDPYVSMAFGKTIGVDQNYSTLGLWLASDHQDYLYFIDASWNHAFNSRNSTNLGTGIRFGDDTKGCGINLYWDWLKTRSTNFNQISSGIEGWLYKWTFKLNLYLPLKNRFTFNRNVKEFPGGYVLRTKETLFASQLATLLIGKEWDLSNCYISNLSFLTSAGPYWVGHSRDKNCYGGLIDLDVEMYNIFSWKTIISYDRLFKTRCETIISISIPFGCELTERLCQCFQDFYNRPDRLNWIVTDQQAFCTHNW